MDDGKLKILMPFAADIVESCCNTSGETYEQNKETLKKLAALLRAGKHLHDLVNIEPEPQKQEELTTHDDSEIEQMIDDILDISLLSLDTDEEDCSISNDLEKTI